jgi:hypothetical protein
MAMDMCSGRPDPAGKECSGWGFLARKFMASRIQPLILDLKGKTLFFFINISRKGGGAQGTPIREMGAAKTMQGC